MKEIAVIGLGIIGGSISGALSKAGYAVDGTDLNEEAVAFAQQKGYIRKKAMDLTAYDAVFIAVSPSATIQILKTERFKDGAFVADICGVKQAPERAVYEEPRNYRYIGLHPMAGKETSGIRSASSELFKRANLVITIAEQTDEKTLSEARLFAREMGFGKIVECSAKTHDEKIALTSQLAHVVSNAYVKSEQVQDCDGFTGGSFQDMTRIAGVDEKMWSQLYLCNREPILNELNAFITHICAYRDALEAEDGEKLSQLLKEGRLIRETIKRADD